MRGTTRDHARVGEIEAAGAEAAVADPDLLGTLMPHLEGVSALCWLLGLVGGEPGKALHGPRLESLLAALVDTPVRGVVYEGPGHEIAGRFGQVYRMPVEVLRSDPADHPAWLAEARVGVAKVLGG